jgi:hypothetical protein
LIDIRNHLLPGESDNSYWNRRRIANKLLKVYARFGRPATQSRKGERYVPGPHKSHKPHEVTQNVNVVPWTDAYGKVHDTREFKVMHPGTLVKSNEPVSMVRKVVEGIAELAK